MRPPLHAASSYRLLFRFWAQAQIGSSRKPNRNTNSQAAGDSHVSHDITLLPGRRLNFQQSGPSQNTDEALKLLQKTLDDYIRLMEMRRQLPSPIEYRVARRVLIHLIVFWFIKTGMWWILMMVVELVKYFKDPVAYFLYPENHSVLRSLFWPF